MHDLYIGLALTTDGPHLGRNSILSLACTAHSLDKVLLGTFHRAVRPLPGSTLAEDAAAVFGNYPDALAETRRDPVDPSAALAALTDWLRRLRAETGKGRHLLTSWHPEEFGWLSWYGSAFGSGNPFTMWLDLHSFAMCLLRDDYIETCANFMPLRWADPAVDTDALACAAPRAAWNGALAVTMVRESRGLPPVVGRAHQGLVVG